MNVFDLAAKLALDKSEYDKGLDEAESSGSKFGSGLKKGAAVAAAGVAAVGTAAAAAGKAIVEGTGQVAQYGDNIDKMSQKLGLSYEGFQKWDYVLSQSGADINSMQTGLKTLTNKLDDAKNGGADAQAMFEKLGLSMTDLNNMSREEVFEATIKGFQGMADSTERAALANDLFGKSGQNLTPLFNASAESTEQLMQAAEDLGMVMSDEAVKASAAYQDSLDTLQRTMGGMKNKLLGEFMPGITGVMDGLTQIFGGDSESGIATITDGIMSVTDTITEMMPQILEVGGQIVLQLGSAIIEHLPELTTAAVGTIMTLANGVVDNLPMIFKAAVDVVIAITKGIADNLPILIPAMVDAIVTMADTLTEPENLKLILQTGIELIAAILAGIVEATPKLLKGIGTLFKNVGTALGEEAAKVYLRIDSWIKEKLDSFKTWGKDLIDNFIAGIKEKFENIKETFKELGNIIKNLIGFSEPKEGPLSDFHTFAPDMIDLFIKGVEENKDRLQESVAAAFDFTDAVTAPRTNRGNVRHGKYSRGGGAVGGAIDQDVSADYNKSDITAIKDTLIDTVPNITHRLGDIRDMYASDRDNLRMIKEDQMNYVAMGIANIETINLKAIQEQQASMLTEIKALKEMFTTGKAKAGVNILNARELAMTNV